MACGNWMMTGPWPTVYGAAQTTCIVIWANGTKTGNNSNYTVHTRYKSKDSYKVLCDHLLSLQFSTK